MDETKKINSNFGENEMGLETPIGNTSPPDSPSRARNRTVMLTPEITGQVRARIAQDGSSTRPPPESAPPYAAPHAGGGSAGYSFSGAGQPPPANRSRQVGDGNLTGGRTFQPSSAPQDTTKDAIHYSKKTPVVGFLVSFDVNQNGDVFELRQGRLIITSEAAGQSNCLVLRDDSVSPLHAILRVSQGGEVQVLDQLSEFGTKILKGEGGEAIELSGDKGVVEHGDFLLVGKRKFHVCLLVGGGESLTPSY